jgi:hypothetical protein
VLRVLGVHGVRGYQGEPPEAERLLAGWWSDALAKGLGVTGDRPFTLALGYYAHHLRRATAQGDDDPAALPAGAREDCARWAALLGAPAAVPQGHPTVPLRDLISWVARRYGLETGLARSLATTFFREVHTYFTDAGRRAAAQGSVASAIETIRPEVLIAHSLGSVVAYETLWGHSDLPAVELLVTIGSPLAMPGIVLDRLDCAERRRPPPVRRWINVADPGDIIAIPPGGVPRTFAGVAADMTDVIGAFGYHRVTKYLESGTVAGLVAGRLAAD